MVHFALVAPEAVLRLEEDGIELAGLRGVEKGEISGTLRNGAGKLLVCVAVLIEDDAAVARRSLTAQSDLILDGRGPLAAYDPARLAEGTTLAGNKQD